MKKKTYIKNVFRDMASTKGKILSIFIMILLASSVIVGLFLTGPSMRNTLDETLVEFNHPDIEVKSTYGLNTEDQAIIENDKSIEKLSYIKTYDALSGEDLIRLKSYSEDLGKISIVKGREVRNKDEIVLDINFKDQYKLGETIKFKSANKDKLGDFLDRDEYKIVGFAKSSDYLFDGINDFSYIGKRLLDGFALVKEENFKKDTIAEADISYKESKNLDKFSKEYKSIVGEKKDKLEDDFKNRPKEALEKIKSDANKEIKDAEDDLNKAENELTDKEKELKDAKIALENGFKEYNQGKKEFEDQIKSGQDQLNNSKIELDNGLNELEKAKETYRASEEEFLTKISAGQAQIDQGRAEINKAKEDFEASYQEYQAGFDEFQSQFEGPKNELDQAKSQLDLAKEEIDANTGQYSYLLQNIEKLEASLDSGELSNEEYLKTYQEIQEQKALAEGMKKELDGAKASYEENLLSYQEKRDAFDAAYNENKIPLDQAKEKLDQGKAQLDQKENELTKAQESLNAQKAQGQKELDNAKAQINENEAKLKQGQIDYQNGLKELEDNKIKGEAELKKSYQTLLDNQKKYKEGKEEYDKNVGKAKEEIADGKKEIEDSKKNLLTLKDPVYSIEDIMDNKSISSYHKNSENIDELSKVFPTFFYFVAILVTLTTMKRYIDEQRGHIGTLKSLGYSNKDIENKFYIYGLLPTILGSIVGAIFGRNVLAKIIFDAYSSGFEVLPINYAPSSFVILFTIVLSAFLIFLTIYITNRKVVNENTADLLRERAPKRGSRIFLERISFIWNKLSFMHKVTFRNLFRYKSRMFMTLFGVGGCTALIFFGFAMQDSVKDTSKLQRELITKYDVLSVYDTDSESKDIDDYKNFIKNEETSPISYQTGKVSTEEGSVDVKLIAFKNKKDVHKFINIIDLKRQKIELSDKGAIITENIARKNKLSAGDELEFKDEDGRKKKIKIENICENYLEDYIYMSEKVYQATFDENPVYNSDLIKTNNKDFVDKLKEKEAVQVISEPNSLYKNIDNLMKNLNLVIVIITIVSSILAIVVLFNLTNINIGERIKELATIKVLGFYPKEITGYIYRETFILTIIGIFLGYLLGYAMFRYVLNVVAPDGILISYRIHFRSCLIAALITIGISFIIMIVVHKKLKSIDMAEAMKSVE